MNIAPIRSCAGGAGKPVNSVTSIVVSTRKEQNKSTRIPKFCGVQNLNVTVQPRTRVTEAPGEAKNSFFKSKIPKIPSKNIPLPSTSTSRQQICSGSKICLAVNKLSHNKIPEINSSQPSFKENISTSCRPQHFKGLAPKPLRLMQNISNNTSTEAYNDLRNKIRKSIENCRLYMMDSLKIMQGSEIHKKIEQHQTKMIQDIEDIVNVLVNAHKTEIDSLNAKIRKEIQEGKKTLQQSEKRVADLKSSYAVEFDVMEKEFTEKAEAEYTKRERQLMEINKKLKALEKERDMLKAALQQAAKETNNEENKMSELIEELRSCKENVRTLSKMLIQTESQLKQDRREKQKTVAKIKKLEAELEETRKILKEAQSKVLDEAQAKMKADTPANRREKELQMDIYKLKECIEKFAVEKSDIKSKVDELIQENSSLEKLRAKLFTVEEENRVLKARQKLFVGGSVSRDEYQCQQSYGEMQYEIEKLKVELSNSHFNICQLEEQIQTCQEVLEMREELINSLQANNDSSPNHLKEGIDQDCENTTINELNNELDSKKSKLSRRQAHLIKLLKENNERIQMSRVKQEEKMGRMEDELFHMRQIIAMYGRNLLKKAGCKVTTPEEYNARFY